MPLPCRLYPALCCLVLVLAVAPRSHAFQQNAGAPQAAQALDLAAISAFRGVLEKQAYALPEERVRDVVLAFLRRNPNAPPKTMPTPQDLQQDVNVDFDATWTSMINKATAGLDPKGELGVAQRLRASVNGSPMQADAKQKHAKLVQNDLPAALKRVQETLTKDQTKKLVEALATVVTTEMPGQQQIVAAQANDRTVARDLLVNTTMQKLPEGPEDLRPVLIQESYDGLAAAADNVVADGVTQLDEQLKVLAETPKAVSQDAIRTELMSRLQEVVKGQQAQRQDNKLRPSYGAFEHVTARKLSEASRAWFDARVAKAGEQVAEQVFRNERTPPDEDADVLQQMILGDWRAHHRSVDSARQAETTIQKLTGHGQQWVVDDLLKDLQMSQAPGDKDYPQDQFRKDILDVMTADGTRSREAWTHVQLALRRHYVEVVLPTVREKIAKQQAREYAASLSDQRWIPTETDLRNCELPLQRGALIDLRVWTKVPPQPPEMVLEETWALWLSAARAALEITRQASDEQLKIVDELQVEIGEEIKAQEEPDPNQWEREYAERARQRWQATGSVAARKYPELFESTLDRIKQIVAKLLPAADRKPPVAQPDQPMVKEEPAEQVKPDDAMAQPPTQQTPPTTAPPNAPDAPDAANRQAGTGPAESQGKLDGPGKAEAAGGGDAEEGQGEKKEGTTDEEQKKDEGDGKEDGDGLGEGDGEGDGKPGDDQQKAGDATLVPVPQVQIPPAQPSWADLLYRILIWILLALMLLMTVCWYCHVRYLRRLLDQYRRPVALNVQ